MWLYFVPSVVVSLVGQLDAAPERLRRLLAAPASDSTLEIEWSVAWADGCNDGLEENFVTRASGSTLWEANLGDASGQHSVPCKRHSDGTTTTPGRKNPSEIGKYEVGTRHRMRSDAQIWNLESESVPDVGVVSPIGEVHNSTPIDPLTIGLVPLLRADITANPFRLPQHTFETVEKSTFDQGTVGGKPVVNARSAEGDLRLAWTFDDRQGGQPISAALYYEDELQAESKTSYQRVGDRWVPSVVEFYARDSAEPYKTLTFKKATFNEAWHRKEITPTDMGLLNGSQFHTPSGIEIWNGVEWMSAGDYWELVSVHGVLPDPHILEINAKDLKMSVDEYVAYLDDAGKSIRAANPALAGGDNDGFTAPTKKPKEKDPWDEYVEKFLAENKLPDAAVTRAKEILKQAKSLRDARRKQNAAKIREAKKENDQRKLEKFEEIEQSIFDRMLVRNLKRLVPEKKPDAPMP